MKIALFTETYSPQINGVATHVKTLKEGLMMLGHKVMVVTADSKVLSHCIDNGTLRCPAVELKNLYGYGMASSHSLKRMRIIRNFSPDIVHVHTEFGIGSTGLEIAKEMNIPLIYTQHTMWDEYLHYVASPSTIPTLRKMSHAYLKYFANQADAIIGPSGKVQNFLNTCGVDKEVDIIANAVEVDMFSREQVDDTIVKQLRRIYGISPDDLVICFCGRLAQEKSVDVLLEYFAACHKAVEHIKLMIIGDGPARADLENQARQLGLIDVVIFIGAIPHESVREIYSCCDLYATASLSEVNSISMLEAMAMGLPVLHILDKANVGQVVDGVNGYVFRNENELCNLIIRYRDSSEEEKQRLRASVKASVLYANQTNMAQKVVNVYLRHTKGRNSITMETVKGGEPNVIS